MVPSASTSTDGVKACVVGTVLTRRGAVHVTPPSDDEENAIAEPEGASVASCHTMYILPSGPAPISGMMSPVRSGVPSSGSLMKPGIALLTVIGADQVAPRSSLIMTAISWPFLFAPEPWKSMNTSTSRPRCGPASTTEIWWPMPNWLALGAKIACGVSQVAPPLVVRVKYASLRKDLGAPARECAYRRSLGKRLRSQIAYTKFESNGSAVIEFLSLKLSGTSSSMSTTGGDQVRPPSVDLLTSIADRLPALVESVM